MVKVCTVTEQGCDEKLAGISVETQHGLFDLSACVGVEFVLVALQNGILDGLLAPTHEISPNSFGFDEVIPARVSLAGMPNMIVCFVPTRRELVAEPADASWTVRTPQAHTRVEVLGLPK